MGVKLVLLLTKILIYYINKIGLLCVIMPFRRIFNENVFENDRGILNRKIVGENG